MCGIAGIIGAEAEKGKVLLKNMCDAIAHRGPDAEGMFSEKQAHLGHRRLSIIDLSSAADQPFTDVDNRYVIVFNGEIYNYLDVKKDLVYPWRSSSDTEVILAAYIKWGKDCLQHLNGMFAFAIWDKQIDELFIARDRLGVKPLYYYHNDGMFVFASEIRSILSTGLVKRRIDKTSLVDYLTSMSIKTPNSIIQDVFQLCPGEYALLKNNSLSKGKFWNIHDAKTKDFNAQLSYEETVAKTAKLFEDSVKSRMVADVKVGAFLSGGIDSSAAVACMSELSDKPIETFSIVFDDKSFDESQYSRMIAEKYKTKHREFLLEPKELIKNLPDYISAMDSPTVDGINTYMVSKLVAATGIKVVLTGIGGDELFAGYNNFKRWKTFKSGSLLYNNPLTRTAVKLANSMRKHRVLMKINDLFSYKSHQLSAFYANSRSIFLKEEIKNLIDLKGIQNRPNWIDLDSEDLNKHPVLSRYSVAELSNYTLDVLMKDTDQMSMAWALEVREPFFDYHLIEFLLQVPDHHKFNKDTPKSLLVKALGKRLPDEIVYRPKKGFTFPWNSWIRNDLKDYCHSAILKLSERKLFKPGSLENLWHKFINNQKSVTWVHIWSLVILEKWMEENKIEMSSDE